VIALSPADQKTVENIARRAGEAIMGYYDSGNFSVAEKDNKSPVTDADLAANDIILEALEAQWSWPILSEEKEVPWAVRRHWRSYWLVDPLDGTKGFLKRNAAFTVNIALIHEHRVIFGVVFDPRSGDLWRAALRQGAFVNDRKIFNEGDRPEVVAAMSVEHAGKKTQAFLRKNKISEVIREGSSVKFCRVAEGAADVYPRLSPTSEWDTAAGQIVAEEGGATVLDLVTGKPLRYNKENILNNSFLVFRKGLSLTW
jgi:3'(2'), 5'-bisphosphate nucleotidase